MFQILIVDEKSGTKPITITVQTIVRPTVYYSSNDEYLPIYLEQMLDIFSNKITEDDRNKALKIIKESRNHG